LVKSIPEVVVLCPPDADISKEYIKDWKVKIIGKKQGHAWEQLDLPRYLSKNGNPILLNLCNTGPLFYSYNIVTVHDACFARHKEWYSLPFRLYYNFLVPRLLKKSKAVLTVSQFSKQELITFFSIPSDKIHIASNAVSGAFLESRNDSYSSRKENIILSVSSIDPRKNQKILVEAFEKINDQNWTLYLVGAKHQAFSKQALENSSSTNIKWTGYLEDIELISLYHKASFFVYPSLYEGFGIPPLEAMSVGCPVIVSDIPALKETCGEAAIYFDPNNSDQLASQIEELITNHELRDKLKIAGMAKSAEYSWSKSATIISEVIAKVQNRN